MNRSVLSLIVISLIVLVITSGCIFSDVDAISKVKTHPAAADFLAEHPMAQLTSTLWNEEDSSRNMIELVEKCGVQIQPTDYYYVAFSDGDARLEGWVYQNTMNVACVYRNDDQCSTDVDCEDNFPCTINTCVEIPKRCNTVKIKECIGGDGCCPVGCTFAVDFDCDFDECNRNLNCDDYNPATIDVCIGLPKRCEYEYIIECIDRDGYCPLGCKFSNDNDCGIIECKTASDCNDRKTSTLDFCVGDPGVCVHQEITACVNKDGYCPPRCTYKEDSDCVAQPGNCERIIVNCDGFTTNIDSALEMKGDKLETFINGIANNSNNAGLRFYEFLKYKFDGIEAGNYGTGVKERIVINGRAVFDKETNKNYFYLNKNGLRYELEFQQGLPAVNRVGGSKPFFAGNIDNVPTVLFGKNALFISADQNTEKIQILSDSVELAVNSENNVQNMKAKNGLTYTMRIVRCDEGSAVFSLYSGDNLIVSQTAKPGDILFSEELKKVIRLNYLNKNNITKKCNYKYAKGDYIETFVQGEEFPTNDSKVSPWKTSLEFNGNRLTKIELNNYILPTSEPLESGEDIWILQEGESIGVGFCKVTFYGFVR